MAKKTLNLNGLSHYDEKIKAVIETKVSKEEGKGLSSKDFTEEYENKLKGIASGAQVNSIESISVNGTAQNISNKGVNITVPTNTNQLTNGAGYQTKNDVETLINNKMGSAVHYKGDVETYNDLPTNAQNGDLYNIKTASEHNKAGDNAIWNAGEEKWDMTTGVIDTSNFVQNSDLVEISNAEIDTLFE